MFKKTLTATISKVTNFIQDLEEGIIDHTETIDNLHSDAEVIIATAEIKVAEITATTEILAKEVTYAKTLISKFS